MTRPRSYSATSSTSTFSSTTLSSLPDSLARPAPPPQHRAHAAPPPGAAEQEMALGSMYDYLVKFILIGPSGCGKSPSHSMASLMADRVFCTGLSATSGRR